jgi:hypothetical protein
MTDHGLARRMWHQLEPVHLPTPPYPTPPGPAADGPAADGP